MAASRREPAQQRSRERVDQIVAAAAELLDEGGVEALTTRALAEHSGIPVPTIYRYFADRDEIVLAFLDREFADIGKSVARAVLALDHVSIATAMRATAQAHLCYHEQHPIAVEVWFGGTQTAAIHAYIRAYDHEIARQWTENSAAVGFMSPEMPPFLFDLVARLFNRIWEYCFLEHDEAADRAEIAALGVSEAIKIVEQYATPRGRDGISGAEYAQAMAELYGFKLPLRGVSQ
ncbi:MAG: TetR/AcrR family transcriptional regulator [Solirubrobacterales bacterium]